MVLIYPPRGFNVKLSLFNHTNDLDKNISLMKDQIAIKMGSENMDEK